MPVEQPRSPSAYPDPILTANLYSAGRLDEAVSGVLRPAWRTFKAADPEGSCYLWFMRYGKGGEHLKIRVHGPLEQKPRFSELLVPAAEEHFWALRASPDSPQPGRWKGAPPIDPQDRVTSEHPNRTLLLTDYVRSHINLGGKPFLLDDGYAAQMTKCLAQAAEIALETLSPDGGRSFPHRQRQTALLRTLIAATAALGFEPERRASYFAYHRDCLLRFLLIRSENPFDKARQVLDRFRSQAEGMGHSLERLRWVAAKQWRVHAPAPADALDAAWRAAVVRLYEHVFPLCSDPDYHLDPFAPEPAFAPLFKAFHGLANQLGLGLPDEAFAHHLLLLLAQPGAKALHQVILLPT